MEHIEDYLRITDSYEKDESVESFNYREIDADSINTINSQNEITFTYQNTDAWYLPSKSYLIIEGKIEHNDARPVVADIAAIVGPPAFPADTAYPGITFCNNGIMQMFDTAKYFLGTQQVEYFQNCGITTTIHNILTRDKNFQALEMMWQPDEGSINAGLDNSGYAKRWYFTTNPIPFNNRAPGGNLIEDNYSFGCIIPLSHIFNFCQDYNKVIYGMQHRISFQRRTDNYALHGSIYGSQSYPSSGNPYNNHIMNPIPNVYAGGNPATNTFTNYKINLTKFRWAMPIIKPNNEAKLMLGKVINDKIECKVPFLNKRFESPFTVSAGQTSFTWKLQLSGGYEKPRFICVGFQASQRTIEAHAVVNAGHGSTRSSPGVIAQGGFPACPRIAASPSLLGSQQYNNSVFDILDVNVAYILLNGERFPYADIQSSVRNNQQGKWYRMYKEFRNCYFRENKDDSSMDYIQFLQNPIYVFDVSKQEDKLKTSVVDVSVVMTFNTAPIVNYNAYAVVYFDSLYKLTGETSRQVISHFH